MTARRRSANSEVTGQHGEQVERELTSPTPPVPLVGRTDAVARLPWFRHVVVNGWAAVTRRGRRPAARCRGPTWARRPRFPLLVPPPPNAHAARRSMRSRGSPGGG